MPSDAPLGHHKITLRMDEFISLLTLARLGMGPATILMHKAQGRTPNRDYIALAISKVRGESLDFDSYLAACVGTFLSKDDDWFNLTVDLQEDYYRTHPDTDPDA